MSELSLLASVPKLGKLTEQYMTWKQPGPFSKLFMENVETADGDVYIWEKIRNDRRLAGARDLDVPAYIETAPNQKYIKSGFVHLAVKERITPKELFIRAGIGSPMRSGAQSRILRAIERNVSRIYRGMEYICARLPQDSSGVDLSNANTAFPDGATSINEELSIEGSLQTSAAGAAWDVDTTEIVSGDSQLQAFVATLSDNGYPAGQMILNRALAKEVVGNLEAQSWLTANGSISADFFRKIIVGFGEANQSFQQSPTDQRFSSQLGGLGDIEKWHVWDHVYQNRSGTNTRFMDTDKAILLPPAEVIREAEALCWIWGPVIRPNQLVIGDAAQAEDAFAVGRGIISYAYREHDDVGALYIVTRATFLPLVKDELAVLQINSLTT